MQTAFTRLVGCSVPIQQALWAGESVGEVRHRVAAAEIVAELADGAADLLSRG